MKIEIKQQKIMPNQLVRLNSMENILIQKSSKIVTIFNVKNPKKQIYLEFEVSNGLYLFNLKEIMKSLHS